MCLLRRKRHAPEDRPKSKMPIRTARGWRRRTVEIGARTAAPQARKLRRDDIVALILSPSGAYAGYYTLGDLATGAQRQGEG